MAAGLLRQGLIYEYSRDGGAPTAHSFPVLATIVRTVYQGVLMPAPLYEVSALPQIDEDVRCQLEKTEKHVQDTLRKAYAQSSN